MDAGKERGELAQDPSDEGQLPKPSTPGSQETILVQRFPFRDEADKDKVLGVSYFRLSEGP